VSQVRTWLLLQNKGFGGIRVPEGGFFTLDSKVLLKFSSGALFAELEMNGI